MHEQAVNGIHDTEAKQSFAPLAIHNYMPKFERLSDSYEKRNNQMNHEEIVGKLGKILQFS